MLTLSHGVVRTSIPPARNNYKMAQIYWSDSVQLTPGTVGTPAPIPKTWRRLRRNTRANSATLDRPSNVFAPNHSKNWDWGITTYERAKRYLLCQASITLIRRLSLACRRGCARVSPLSFEFANENKLKATRLAARDPSRSDHQCMQKEPVVTVASQSQIWAKIFAFCQYILLLTELRHYTARSIFFFRIFNQTRRGNKMNKLFWFYFQIFHVRTHNLVTF